MLAMEKPGRLRMKGSRVMLPTLFDLLCDGVQVTLYIPRENTVYRAGGDIRAGRGIPDLSLLTGIFFGQAEPEGAFHFLEARPSQYIVYTARPERRDAGLVRKVLFDRTDLSPVLYQHFDTQGRLEFQVRCTGFVTPRGGSAPVPQEVTIENPGEGRILSLRLRDVCVNIPLNPALFTFEAPPGSRIRPLEEYGR
jgi:hypothetical protein